MRPNSHVDPVMYGQRRIGKDVWTIRVRGTRGPRGRHGRDVVRTPVARLIDGAKPLPGSFFENPGRSRGSGGEADVRCAWLGKREATRAQRTGRRLPRLDL